MCRTGHSPYSCMCFIDWFDLTRIHACAILAQVITDLKILPSASNSLGHCTAEKLQQVEKFAPFPTTPVES